MIIREERLSKEEVMKLSQGEVTEGVITFRLWMEPSNQICEPQHDFEAAAALMLSKGEETGRIYNVYLGTHKIKFLEEP